MSNLAVGNLAVGNLAVDEQFEKEETRRKTKAVQAAKYLAQQPDLLQYFIHYYQRDIIAKMSGTALTDNATRERLHALMLITTDLIASIQSLAETDAVDKEIFSSDNNPSTPE